MMKICFGLFINFCEFCLSIQLVLKNTQLYQLTLVILLIAKSEVGHLDTTPQTVQQTL